MDPRLVGNLLLIATLNTQPACSVTLFGGNTNAAAPTVNVTPAPDDREVPPVDVAGVHLEGDVVYSDGTPATGARVDLIDESANKVTHSSQPSQSPEFALPVSKIQEPTLTIRIKIGDRFIFSDVVLPADISAAVNAERVGVGGEALKNFSPSGSPAFKLEERKLVLVLPANGIEHAETNEAVLVGNKMNIIAISVPKKADAAGKRAGALTSIENLSTSSFVKFAWRKTLVDTSSVRIVFAKSEAELSAWNGTIDTAPVWPNQPSTLHVLGDYGQCSDPIVDGRPMLGALSATTDSSCGTLRTEFPFNDGGNVFARLVAESATEIRLSEVFFFAPNNAPPAISVVETAPVKSLVNLSTTFKITIKDSDSTLSCSKSLSARSKNSVFLPDKNISFTGQSSDCEMKVNGLQKQESSSEVVIRVVDDKGSSAQVSVVIVRGWQRTSLDTSMLGLVNGDSFGSAVALSQNILAVAANGDDLDDGGIITPDERFMSSSNTPNSGAVYVYLRQAGTWVRDAFIKAQNNHASLSFGQSLSISDDTLVVGTTQDKTVASSLRDSNKMIVSGPGALFSSIGDTISGAVYVYQRAPDGAWSRQAFIKAFNTSVDNNFGGSVSISGDTLAVGASKEDSGLINVISGFPEVGNTGHAQESGAVYVYKRTHGIWAPEAFVKGFRAAQNDNFGESVSVHGDTLAVSAPGDDYGKDYIISGDSKIPTKSDYNNGGAVYLFRRDTTGKWGRDAFIKGPHIQMESYFGKQVSLSENTLAVGVQRDSYVGTTIVNAGDAFNLPHDVSSPFYGSVYVYSRDAAGWKHEAYIKPTNSAANAEFGSSLSLFGNQLAVGARGENSTFDSQPNGFNKPDLNGLTAPDAGAVYMFQRVDKKWFQVNYFKAETPAAYDFFGESLALHGDSLAVGARNKNSGRGAVYLFEKTQP